MSDVELLEDVKNYLDITWTEETTDRKLTGIISRGMAYLDSAAGGTQDYKTENAARALLFDYVRYVYSNAFEDFLNNYLSEILSLQIKQEVATYAEKESANL